MQGLQQGIQMARNFFQQMGAQSQCNNGNNQQPCFDRKKKQDIKNLFKCMMGKTQNKEHKKEEEKKE